MTTLGKPTFGVTLYISGQPLPIDGGRPIGIKETGV